MVMNLEYILGQLRFQAEAAYALLSRKGAALAQADMITLAIAAVIGILFCFFGLKMVRFWAAIFGLAAGLAGGSSLAAYLGLSGYIPLIIGGVAGIILAVLGARFYLAGVFLVEWILGSLGSAYFIKPSDWKFALVCVGIGLVVALIALKFTEPVTMLITGIAGGFLAGQAIYVMVPLNNTPIHIAIIAVLAILGTIVQFLLESRRRKKLHLKKAEEIRKKHSVANEVDKARAMMENLDGETSAPKEKASKAGKADADTQSVDKAVSEDSLADADEDIDEEFLEGDLEDDDDFQILEFPEDEK